MRLVGTTKPTIIAIKERTHWNSPSLVAQDPVTLGLCSQIDLDAEVKKAAARLARERGTVEPGKVETLLPAEETIEAPVPEPVEREAPMATALAQEARRGHGRPGRGGRRSGCRFRLRQAERPEARLALPLTSIKAV